MKHPKVSKKHLCHIVPECVYKGLDKELDITQEQIQLLEKISAPRNEIASVEAKIQNPPDVWTDLNCINQ